MLNYDDCLGRSVAWFPPRFGGLCEKPAGAPLSITFEKFSILAIQIKAWLNSHPFSPLITDPQDATVLTPDHFLVGIALTALTEPDTINLSVLGPVRYRLTTQMRDNFWRRWQKEVLHLLQQRSKLLESSHTVQEGDHAFRRRSASSNQMASSSGRAVQSVKAVHWVLHLLWSQRAVAIFTSGRYSVVVAVWRVTIFVRPSRPLAIWIKVHGLSWSILQWHLINWRWFLII